MRMCAVQTFAALWRKFCRLMAQVLPPYGPVLKKTERSTKSWIQILGVGCVCVKVSPRTACCCQK